MTVDANYKCQPDFDGYKLEMQAHTDTMNTLIEELKENTSDPVLLLQSIIYSILAILNSFFIINEPIFALKNVSFVLNSPVGSSISTNEKAVQHNREAGQDSDKYSK